MVAGGAPRLGRRQAGARRGEARRARASATRSGGRRHRSRPGRPGTRCPRPRGAGVATPVPGPALHGAPGRPLASAARARARGPAARAAPGAWSVRPRAGWPPTPSGTSSPSPSPWRPSAGSPRALRSGSRRSSPGSPSVSPPWRSSARPTRRRASPTSASRSRRCSCRRRRGSRRWSAIHLVPVGLLLVPALVAVGSLAASSIAIERRILARPSGPTAADRTALLGLVVLVAVRGLHRDRRGHPRRPRRAAADRRRSPVAGPCRSRGWPCSPRSTASWPGSSATGWPPSRGPPLRGALGVALSYAAVIAIAAAALRAMALPRLLGPALLTLVLYLWSAYRGVPRGSPSGPALDLGAPPARRARVLVVGSGTWWRRADGARGDRRGRLTAAPLGCTNGSRAPRPQTDPARPAPTRKDPSSRDLPRARADGAERPQPLPDQADPDRAGDRQRDRRPLGRSRRRSTGSSSSTARTPRPRTASPRRSGRWATWPVPASTTRRRSRSIPTNRIAERNIDRLKLLLVEAGDRTVAADPTSKAPVSIFVEETGKTGFAHLVELARPKVLAQVNPGDYVELVAEGKHLIAFSNGIRVGVVEPRVAARLLKLIANGNKYAAGVTSLGAQDVRIIIREIYQDPRNYGKVSFPTAATVRRPPPVHEGHPPARGRGPRGRSRGRHRGRGDRGPRSRHPRRGHPGRGLRGGAGRARGAVVRSAGGPARRPARDRGPVRRTRRSRGASPERRPSPVAESSPMTPRDIAGRPAEPLSLPIFARLAPALPAELIAARIEAATAPDDVVIDLFGRGGWVARTALALGRRAVSIETSPLSRLLADVVVRAPGPAPSRRRVPGRGRRAARHDEPAGVDRRALRDGAARRAAGRSRSRSWSGSPARGRRCPARPGAPSAARPASTGAAGAASCATRRRRTPTSSWRSRPTHDPVAREEIARRFPLRRRARRPAGAAARPPLAPPAGRPPGDPRPDRGRAARVAGDVRPPPRLPPRHPPVEPPQRVPGPGEPAPHRRGPGPAAGGARMARAQPVARLRGGLPAGAGLRAGARRRPVRSRPGAPRRAPRRRSSTGRR